MTLRAEVEELKKGIESLTRKLEAGKWKLCFYIQRNVFFIPTEYGDSNVTNTLSRLML